MADNVVRIRASLDDKVSGSLAQMRDKFDTLGKSKGFQSIVSGVGLGIGVAAWSMASSKIVDVLGDATQAALDEEASIQKLGTALRANVKDWDGNTAGIERVLKARMTLGFSDDEQRDSLAKLVAATGDATKALDIQRTAMDLARFKGISLAEATDALTKVEAGSFRILKGLGIELKANATQTEALAAVQKVAAGQAEDWANTNAGKLLVSQVKVGEAMEKLGASTLPLVVSGMEAAATGATALATTLDLLQHGAADTAEGQREQLDATLDIAKALAFLNPMYGSLADAQRDAMDSALVTSDKSTDAVEKMRGSIVGDLGDLEDAAVDWRDKFRDTSGDVIRRSAKVREALSDDAQGIIDSYFDPIETRAEIYDTRAERRALLEERRGLKTKSDFRNNADDIIQTLDDQGSALVDLGKTGALTAGAVDQFEADVKASYKAMGKTIPPEIEAILKKLRALAGMTAEPFKVRVQGTIKSSKDSHGPGRGNLEFAEGGRVPGPVGAPVAATVHGGEVVLSNAMQRSGVGSGAVAVTVVVNPAPGMTTGQGREFGEAAGPALVAWMQRNGYLPRTGTGLTG